MPCRVSCAAIPSPENPAPTIATRTCLIVIGAPSSAVSRHHALAVEVAPAPVNPREAAALVKNTRYATGVAVRRAEFDDPGLVIAAAGHRVDDLQLAPDGAVELEGRRSGRGMPARQQVAVQPGTCRTQREGAEPRAHQSLGRVSRASEVQRLAASRICGARAARAEHR